MYLPLHVLTQSANGLSPALSPARRRPLLPKTPILSTRAEYSFHPPMPIFYCKCLPPFGQLSMLAHYAAIRKNVPSNFDYCSDLTPMVDFANCPLLAKRLIGPSSRSAARRRKSARLWRLRLPVHLVPLGAAFADARRASPSSEALAPRRAFRDRQLALSSSLRIMRSASAARRAASVRAFNCVLARVRGTVSVARGANSGRCYWPSRVQRQMLARPTPQRAAISP